MRVIVAILGTEWTLVAAGVLFGWGSYITAALIGTAIGHSLGVVLIMGYYAAKASRT